MTELHFWGECKKTLERDLPIEEYSTWIAPLTLEQNNGSNPLSYSVLAPNKFISDWVEDNYGITIKERLSAITSMRDLNLNFEIFVDYHGRRHDEDPATDSYASATTTRTTQTAEEPKKNNLIDNFTFETFVEGRSNHIALAASRQIGDGLKNSYKKKFIYGGVGLGKTP
jgi:ATPase involved in DNA replication initiation